MFGTNNSSIHYLNQLTPSLVKLSLLASPILDEFEEFIRYILELYKYIVHKHINMLYFIDTPRVPTQDICLQDTKKCLPWYERVFQ